MMTPREQVEYFLNNTMDARALSEKCRDYYDGKQWTDQEVARLRKRNQAPIVVNRVKPKVEGLVGLYDIRKTDPKAYPRTKKHEESAEAMTDALRYVSDDNNLGQLRLDVAEDFFVEGYGGVIVDVRQKKKGGIDIRVGQIPWDRIYFDPHSRKKDFSDSRYFGIWLWMYTDEIKEKFPNADLDAIMAQSTDYVDETTNDRPSWTYDSTLERRARIALHFRIVNGEWTMSCFCGDYFLIEEQVSPYLDDDDVPTCPIELVSAFVARRDNARYGEAKSFLDQQDEINRRRSKGLHLLSTRQTHGRKGAILTKDMASFKRELAKPDGHIEWHGEEFGKDFGVMPTNDMGKAQFDLYLDAKAELDAVSYNAQLAGNRQNGDLSGRAIDKLQQAGAMELNRQYTLLAEWEKRVYRQIWCRVKQFWNEEKWIRVTDNQDALRWVGLNTQITTQQFLEETINDESKPLIERQQASAIYQPLMQTKDQNPMSAAVLGKVIEVRNPVAELDCDIIIDQSFDVVNIQQEQFQLLAQFAQGSDVDILDLIELSQLRGKKELIEKIEKRRAAAAEATAGAADAQNKNLTADTMGKMAKAGKDQQEALQKSVETQLLIANPRPVTSVAV